MLNKAEDYSKLELNPLGRIKQLEEINFRERVLNPEEFNLLLQHCPEHLKSPFFDRILPANATSGNP